MTDTMISQNIGISSWDTLYNTAQLSILVKIYNSDSNLLKRIFLDNR
jgi:hypothetical protein